MQINTTCDILHNDVHKIACFNVSLHITNVSYHYSPSLCVFVSTKYFVEYSKFAMLRKFAIKFAML